MIQVSAPKDCCGCTACESICPHEAIKMQPDGLGFLYPIVDKNKCENCGLCEKVCTFHKDYDWSRNLAQPFVYAAKHKDLMEVAASQSGAAFAVLSDYILEQGGVVYGVGYGEHFRAIHKRAVTKNQRDEFRRSKYVQSDLKDVFFQVKNDLKSGLIVMFSGTPCQTAGLASFIGNRFRNNLYLMDIVCHGVPSPKVWDDYLSYLEKKEKMRITAVNFRDKGLKGWRSHVESFCFDDTYTYTYTYTFYTHIMLRHSCGSCPYTNLQRPSDITVGDFWGIEKTKAAKLGEDNKGCSLMLINTEKGKGWFERIKDKMHTIQVSTEDCLQPNLQSPSVLHPKRDEFEKDYIEYGLERTLKKYNLMGWKIELKKTFRKLYSYIPKPIKNLLRRIIGK